MIFFGIDYFSKRGIIPKNKKERSRRRSGSRDLVLRAVLPVESSHMSANAERIVAAEAAKLAVELVTAVVVVDVSHVSFHVGLVHALVRAEGTGEWRAARIHPTAGLHMFLQQVLQRVDFLAVGAHVSLVHSKVWLGRALWSVVVHVIGHVPVGRS